MSRLAVAALLIAAGCHWDLNDPGTSPQVSQFYFPAAVTLDPGGRYAYVSNGNADLRYGGGTVQVVDLLRFDCAVAAFCSDPANACSHYAEPACNDEVAKLQAIADLTVDPKRNTTVKPSDKICELDPIDPAVVNCDETPFMVPNAVVRVGNFAGEIRVRSTGQNTRQLFVAVRGDPSITVIDVDLSKIDQKQAINTMPGVLSCSGNGGGAMPAGYDASNNILRQAPSCDSLHVVQNYGCGGYPNCTADTTLLPTEPFAIEVQHAVNAEGGNDDRLVVGHLGTGQVSVLDSLDSAGGPIVKHVSDPFFNADQTGRHGAFAFARQNPNDQDTTWYMTSNIQSIISTFRIADLKLVVPSVSFSVGGAFAFGNDFRDIHFEPGGNRAFITAGNPPSVVVLDTRSLPQGNTPGQPQNRLVDNIDVCQSPSHMGVRRTLASGATGTPARTRTELYVACFLSNQVMVVDPDLPGVEDTILLGRGPNEIVFNYSDTDDPNPLPEPAHRRAWVNTYSEMALAELDLDPASPTHNRMVARIGKPVPPPTP
jgi:DNA-binding beta-propeller fold protein YncE